MLGYLQGVIVEARSIVCVTSFSSFVMGYLQEVIVALWLKMACFVELECEQFYSIIIMSVYCSLLRVCQYIIKVHFSIFNEISREILICTYILPPLQMPCT